MACGFPHFVLVVYRIDHEDSKIAVHFRSLLKKKLFLNGPCLMVNCNHWYYH